MSTRGRTRPTPLCTAACGGRRTHHAAPWGSRRCSATAPLGASTVSLALVDRRRLLLGDWTPYLRDGIDLLRIGLVLATAAALVAGETAGALALGFATVLALLARVINLPRAYDLPFVLVLSLHAMGEALGW